MELPKLTVLMATYRQPEVLTLTLRDLNKQDYPTDLWELVVIDDGSRDASAQLVMTMVSKEFNVTVKSLPTGGVFGFSALFNEALRLADPASQAFVHVEDMRIRPDFLKQHAKWHRTEEMFLVTGPMCEGGTETFDPKADGRWPLMSKSGISSQAYCCDFRSIFSKGMSYPRTLLDRLRSSGDKEPWDSAMVGWGLIEVEFAYRAERAGATCVYDVSCASYHPTHNHRDELAYREIDRMQAMKLGYAQNTEYFCRKHGLVKLPDEKPGVPIETPPV